MKKLRWIPVLGILVGFTAPLQAQDLHGSIAFSQESAGGHAWGIAWSFDSAGSAAREAINQCSASGGTLCSQVGWFQEACGALAIGDGNGYGTGWGATTATAEQDALAQCRAVNDNCRIEVARCSQSEDSVGSADTQEEAALKEDSEDLPCEAGIWLLWGDERKWSLADVWTGDCVGGKASGQGTAVWCNRESDFPDFPDGFEGTWAYEGPMRAGVADGFGVMLELGGSAFECTFRDGRYGDDCKYSRDMSSSVDWTCEKALSRAGVTP